MKTPFNLRLPLSIPVSALLASIAIATNVPAPYPPMGWNSWNWHGKIEINEQVVRETIDAMAVHGLLDAGYKYVVVDGGWRDTTLGPNGELKAHPVKFPSGIKALADYAHARGFKFGLHTVPGRMDCGGDAVGGWGVEEVQIAQFVEWGVNFIKLDRCRLGPDLKWSEAQIEAVYRKWHRLLGEAPRPIMLSISAYEYRDWYREVSVMARTTLDIDARVSGSAIFDRAEPQFNFLSVMRVADLNNQVADEAGVGFWNDPDMLVTGEQGLTEAEQQTHFALWCIMSSPLMLGNDPRFMTEFERDLITNPRLLAINQDPLEQGRRIIKTGMAEVWQKSLSDGGHALLLLNRNSEADQRFEIDLSVLGPRIHNQATDAYTGDVFPLAGQIDLRLEPRTSQMLIFEK